MSVTEVARIESLEAQIDLTKRRRDRTRARSGLAMSGLLC